MERRTILKQYFLSLTVIFCLLAFFAGAVTVKERTAYNMELTQYDRVTVEEKENGLKFRFGESEIFLDEKLVLKAGKGKLYSFMSDFFAYMSDFFEKNVD